MAEDKNKKGDRKEYEKYFEDMLKKYNAKSPEDLDDDKKREFFNEVDKGWKADHEVKSEFHINVGEQIVVKSKR